MFGLICSAILLPGQPSPAMLSVVEFLPENYVRDGSVSYHTQIQNAIDAAAKTGRTLVFPPMTYRVDESGLRLHSELTLWMYGAKFQLDAKRDRDGTVFIGNNVHDINLFGGSIIGRNDVWPEAVNIRGVLFTGKSKNIRIRDMRIENMSSNGIAVFGNDQQFIRDVWINDVTITNCCNRYGDYLSKKVGPAKGSDRKDQGLIAFYYVQDFVVRGCRLEKSRSDGTHFYKCRQGQFVHNRVYHAQMGGYFVESSDDILASDNVIRSNGSRGVTIERGSQNCTLKGNVVTDSGREGLWAPDCTGLVICGNIFKFNGRKPNGKKTNQIWNANITINEARVDPTNSPTRDYIVTGNIIFTDAKQISAVRVVGDSNTSGIVITGNVMRGENRRILVTGKTANGVLVKQNH